MNKEQILDTPFFTANISFYKRILSTYNLKIRNCSQEDDTEWYIWHEAIIGGRRSKQIASCVFKKLQYIANTVSHMITYSDTCRGQNINIYMAIMFDYVATYYKNISIINQKFLCVMHTMLELKARRNLIPLKWRSPEIGTYLLHQFRSKKPFTVEKKT